MTIIDEELKESILVEKTTDKVEPSVFDNFPWVTKELLEGIQKVFDIRKIVRYNANADYLRGIQDVLDFLETKHKEQLESK